MSFDLVEALLCTRALRVAPPGEVFWYHSGTVGPYYINTHFLFGGEETATDLLEFIEREKERRRRFPDLLQRRVEQQYVQDPVYRSTVDRLVEAAHGGQAAPDCISGGERRDWFFSAAVASRLELPHLLLYKDQTWTLWGPGGQEPRVQEIHGLTTTHVADLVTEASSYTGVWIPALRRCGARMGASVNVVDRGQGGLARLEQAGVGAQALVRVDRSLFDRLLSDGVVGPEQHELLCAYFADPRGAMRSFLQAHPHIVTEALASDDPKTAARARLLVRENPYGLDFRE